MPYSIFIYITLNYFLSGFVVGLYWKDRDELNWYKSILFLIMLFLAGVFIFLIIGIIYIWDKYLYKKFKNTKAYEIYERINLWYNFTYLKKPLTRNLNALYSLKRTLTRRNGKGKHHLFKRFILKLVNDRIKQLENGN